MPKRPCVEWQMVVNQDRRLDRKTTIDVWWDMCELNLNRTDPEWVEWLNCIDAMWRQRPRKVK